MKKKINIYLTALLVFGCSQSKPTNQISNSDKSKDSISSVEINNSLSQVSEKPTSASLSTEKIFGVDLKMKTVFLDHSSIQKFPDSLSVLTGKIFRTGSEPFTRLSLFVSDTEVYSLSGDKVFIDFAENNQTSELKVVGKIYRMMNQNWIKVYFVYNKK